MNREKKINNKKPKSNNFLWIFVLFVLIFFGIYLFLPSINNGKTVPISQLIKDLKDNQVKSLQSLQLLLWPR